jgi:hypothetical protein
MPKDVPLLREKVPEARSTTSDAGMLRGGFGSCEAAPSLTLTDWWPDRPRTA